MSLEYSDIVQAMDKHHRVNYQQEQEIESDYSDGVPVAQDVNTGEIVRVSPDAKTRMGVFGESGSTKTILSKAFAFRLLDEGYDKWKIFHTSDIKNDFQKVNKKGGASKSLQDFTSGLRPGEEPASVERILAIPHILTDYYDSYPSSYSTVFTLKLSDLTEKELKYLLRYKEWSSQAAQDVFDSILRSYDLDEDDVTLRDLQDDAERRRQWFLKRKLEKLRSSGMINPRVKRSMQDVVDKFEEYDVLSLGLKWYRKIPARHYRFYSAKMIRMIKEKKINGDLEAKLLNMKDEAHKLIPKNEESKVAKEIQEYYDVTGRQLDIPTLLSSQRPSQVPHKDTDDDMDFLSQMTDVFIMKGRKNLSDSDWKEVLHAMEVYDKTGGKKLTAWKNKMDSLKQHQGLYINWRHKGPGDCPVIRSLSPTVAHPNENNES